LQPFAAVPPSSSGPRLTWQVGRFFVEAGLSMRRVGPVLATVPLRRIDEETGVTENVHADDHVIPHVLAVRHGCGDVEFPPLDDDLGMDDVPHLQLRGGRSPDAHSIEDRSQAGPGGEVRVERRAGRAGVDPGEYPDAALRPDHRDLFHHRDRRPLLDLRLAHSIRANWSHALPRFLMVSVDISLTS